MTVQLIAMEMESVFLATVIVSQDSLALTVPEIHALCCVAGMENTKKDTVSAEMAGRGQSVTFQKSNALTQRALATAPASWESASVCQDIKEKYARKRIAWIQCVPAMASV